MDEKPLRSIFYYKNYYLDFFRTLQDKVRKKFNWTLKLVCDCGTDSIKVFQTYRRINGTLRNPS